MESKKKYTMYAGDIVISFPCECKVDTELKLPNGMMQLYPDYLFSCGSDTFVSVSRTEGRQKKVEESLMEIIIALRNGESEFELEGVWKRKVHGLEIAKLHYNTKLYDHRWSHMLATFEVLGEQYLIMVYTKMIQKEIWEESFDKILEKLEIRYG